MHHFDLSRALQLPVPAPRRAILIYQLSTLQRLTAPFAVFASRRFLPGRMICRK